MTAIVDSKDPTAGSSTDRSVGGAPGAPGNGSTAWTVGAPDNGADAATPDRDAPSALAPPLDPTGAGFAARHLVPLGRLFFTGIFLWTLPAHFAPETVGYAAQKGVPLASLAVPLSGVLAFAGGSSVLLGYRARLGAWLLVLFLAPVTVVMHDFWAIEDPASAGLEWAMFSKNLALLGAALLIAYFGAGPWSLDARRGGRRDR